MKFQGVASFFAVAVGLMIVAPAETSARGGGFGDGHAAPVGFRTPMARPAMVGGYAMSSHRVPQALQPAIAGSRGVPSAHFRHHRRPVIVWIGAPWNGGNDYDPPTFPAVPPAFPAASDSPASQPTQPAYSAAADYPDARSVDKATTINTVRRSCDTQTYEVPSEAGGKVSINVVRC